MTEKISYIPSRLKNASVGGHVAGAADIIDDALNKTQEEINGIVLEPSNGLKDRVEQLEEQVSFDGSWEAAETASAVVSGSPGGGKITTANAVRGAIDVRTGYFECATAGSTARKDVLAAGFVLTTGGHIKVKMTSANTADNATMNISPTSTIVSANTKTLYYNGEPASASNSWEEGEVISVYYDGTNYQASNAQGGGGNGKKNLTGTSGFISTANVDTQGAVPTPSTNANYVYIKYGVDKGDVLLLTAKGSNTVNGKIWAFADANDNYTEGAEIGDTAENMLLIVPDGVKWVILNNNITTCPEYKWYYAKAGSVGAHEMLTESYLYGDLRILTIGETYKVDEAVKTTDKQLRRVTNAITSLSLSEPLAVGELKTANNTTYRSESAINVFNPSTEYTEGAYALGSMTVYTLTVSAENINAGNITVNEIEVAIEATDDAATIASKISSALNIEGWTDSASDNVITVRCNTIGNNTTTIIIPDTDSTGVVVDGISTPSETGTNIIRKYNGESWATAAVSDLITDGILVEADATWLLTNNTEQNSVQKDISSIVSNRIGDVHKEVSISFAKTTKSQWQYTNNGVVAVSNNNWTRSTNYIDVSGYYSVKLAFIGVSTWSEISTFFTGDNNRMIGTELLNDTYDYKEFIIPEGATRLYYSTRTATWPTFAAKGVIEPTVAELLNDINTDIASTTEKLDDRTLTQDALSISNYGLRNCIIAVGTKKWYDGTNTRHRIIPIGNYKAFVITANSTEPDGAYYGFLKDATVNVGESPVWASGESALRNVPIGQTRTTKDVPEDANYLYIHCTNSNQTYQPDAISGILELKYAVDDINSSIDELEEVKTAVLGTGNIRYTGEKINLRTSYSLSMKKLFNVFNSGVSMQGAAVYGDKLFQFYVGGTCYVYNLLDGSLIESFKMNALSTAHLGSPHFSNTFRNEGDEYPLLYVNGQDALGTGVICDYIVIDINGKADAEIVNSVTLEGFGIQSVCNAFDFDNGIGYSICGSSIVQPFKLSDSSWDINDRISYKPVGHIQDAVYCNGYIYINTGWYTNNETVKILGINVAEKRVSTVVDLGNANRESEGLSIYNNKLIMTIKGLNAAYEINPG